MAAPLTNKEVLLLVQKKAPQFNSLTSKITADVFTEAGYDRMKNLNFNALTDFYGISMRVYLNFINVADVKDTLELGGFGESFDTPYGALVQRMAIHPMNPVSPAFKNLENGGSIDPFVIRKGKVEERIWKQNFDFQTMLTIPSEAVFRQMFISEYGISEMIDGQIRQMRNSYAVQKYLAKKEAINAFLKGTVDALQDTQQIQVDWTTGTDEEMLKLILSIKNIVSYMNVTPTTSAFNALHFETHQDISRLKLLIRVGFKNKLAVNILRNSFNAENLNLPVDVIEVDNFGGLEPYKEAAFTTKLYPVYDEKLGNVIGYSETKNQTGISNVAVETHEVFWKDTNANVLAILADKGLVYTTKQTDLAFDTIYNPRGRYTNYFMSMQNGGVHYDSLYTGVVFKVGEGSSVIPPGFVP